MNPSEPYSPAFPTLAEVNGKEVVGSDGMNMREWYAGMALQGLLASVPEDAWLNGIFMRDEKYARTAFQIADAMLDQGKKKEAP